MATDPTTTALAASGMSIRRFIAEEKGPARLAVPRKATVRPEDDEDSARLIQPSPVAGMARRDHSPALLGRPEAVAGVAENQDRPGLQAPARAVQGWPPWQTTSKPGASRLAANSGPVRPSHLDDGLPGADQARRQQPLTLGPVEADPRMAEVEEGDDLGVDPDEVANLGDEDDGTDRAGCRRVGSLTARGDLGVFAHRQGRTARDELTILGLVLIKKRLQITQLGGQLIPLRLLIDAARSEQFIGFRPDAFDSFIELRQEGFGRRRRSDAWSGAGQNRESPRPQ